MINRLRKRRHYKERYKINMKKIWDLEFLIAQMRANREQIREQHDRLKEMIDAAFVRMNKERDKKKPDQKVMKSLNNGVKKWQKNVDQFKGQMDQVDEEVKDLKSKIDGLRQMIVMLKQFRKKQ